MRNVTCYNVLVVFHPGQRRAPKPDSRVRLASPARRDNALFQSCNPIAICSYHCVSNLPTLAPRLLKALRPRARRGWLMLSFVKLDGGPVRPAQSERNVRISDHSNLRPDDSYEPQLVINELALPPGGEWSPQLPGWSVIHVNSGVGYWLHPHLNWALPTGTVVLLSDQIQGCIRASQVTELRLHYLDRKSVV